jgi:hypothetical protein
MHVPPSASVRRYATNEELDRTTPGIKVLASDLLG